MRNITAAVGLMMLLGAPGASAAPREPLVVTQLPDPDPNFVPPPEPKAAARRSDEADKESTIDQAMEGFGRAIGQAAVVIRQKAQEQCRDRIPANVPAEQRYAWEASCSYQRY